MKYNGFAKSNIKNAREDIQKKLDELKELGLEISIGNIKFRDDEFTTKIIVKVQGTEADEIREFRRSFESTFCRDDAIGSLVKLQGETFEFKGFKPRARKNKAIIENDKGSYCCQFHAIESQLSNREIQPVKIKQIS